MPARTTTILVGLLIGIALVIGFFVFRRPARAPEVSVPEATQEAAPLPQATTQPAPTGGAAGPQQPATQQPATQPTTPSPQPQPGPQPAPQTVTVRYTGSAFTPSTVTIKKGDAVKFVNESSVSIRVSSNPHPIHTDLPGFDSLSSIAVGASYNFTFSQIGTWGYHNHLSPSIGGTVVVQ